GRLVRDTSEAAEVEMAVGDERLHAQIRRDRRRFPVVILGLQCVGWRPARGDLAEETKSPCLVAPFTVLPRQCDGLVSQRDRLLEAISTQTGGAPVDREQRAEGPGPRRLVGVDRSLEEGEPLVEAPDLRIGVAEIADDLGQPDAEVPFLAD